MEKVYAIPKTLLPEPETVYNDLINQSGTLVSLLMDKSLNRTEIQVKTHIPKL